MMAAAVVLQLTSGDDEQVVFSFATKSGPLDVSGRSYAMQVRNNPLVDTEPDLEFIVSVLDGPNGKVYAFASSTDTAMLIPGENYWWSLLEEVDGLQSTLLRGRVQVVWQVTREELGS